MEGPQPWDRQAGEGDKPWAAFVAYRDLGPRRTISAALRAAEQKPGSQRRWEKWASEHRWKARVRAWDAEVDRRAQEAQVEAREEMVRRHLELATDCLTLAQKQLKRILENEKAGKVNIWAVLQLIAVGTQLERATRGAPAEGDEKKPELTWAELMLLAEEKDEEP